MNKITYKIGDLVKDKLTGRKMIVTYLGGDQSVSCRFEVNFGQMFYTSRFNQEEILPFNEQDVCDPKWLNKAKPGEKTLEVPITKKEEV